LALLDHSDVAPNPARDRRVKLPREREAHMPTPLAEHAAYRAGSYTPYWLDRLQWGIRERSATERHGRRPHPIRTSPHDDQRAHRCLCRFRRRE
jgi:hypothetical protein